MDRTPKPDRKASSRTADEHALADAVRESAQQIWQAGLGAFAKAQHEGSAWFDKLVQEGAALHALTGDHAHAQGQHAPASATGVAGKMSRLAGQVGRQASGSWDRIEKLFEERVALALRSLGVPTHDDVAQLRRELDDVRAMLEAATEARDTAAEQAPGRSRRKAASAASLASSATTLGGSRRKAASAVSNSGIAATASSDSNASNASPAESARSAKAAQSTKPTKATNAAKAAKLDISANHP